MKDATPKDVYTELFRQAWAPLQTSPANLLDDPTLAKITVNVDHQPFWLVMRQLEHSTGFGLVSEPDGYRLHRASRMLRGPAAISGPFLVVLTGVRPSFTDPQQISVNLSVYAEPKVHLLAIDPNMQITQPADNGGSEVQVFSPCITDPGDVEYGPQQILVSLTVSARHAHDLRFKASTTASIAVATDRLEIDDLEHAKPQSIQSGGETINFLNQKKSGSVYDICFGSGNDPLDQFQKINVGQPGWQLRVFDDTGQLLPRALTTISTDGPASQMTLIYGPRLFGKPMPQPRKLVWNFPGEIQVVPLNIDFGNANIPLPGF
jgi:hypothetical protein